MPKSIVLTRGELYDLVWERPVRKVAEDLGISDVGLAKICRRHLVPLPYRGYWAQLRAGRKVVKQKLPERSSVKPEKIEIVISDEAPLSDPLPQGLQDELNACLKRENRFLNGDRVKENLRNAHPLVTKTRDIFNRVHIDSYGRLTEGRRVGSLDILVGPDNVNRSLRIFHTILTQAQRRGYSVEQAEGFKPKTWIVVHGQKIGVRLEEPSKLLPKGEVRTHKIKDPDYGWVRHVEQKYGPTGDLALKLTNPAWSSVTHTWKDKGDKKIESCLSDFFRSALIVAFDRIAHDRQSAEDREIRLEQERLENESKQAAKQLHELVEQHEAAQKLRRFVDLLVEAGVQMDHPIGRWGSWREWVDAYLSEIDPIQVLKEGRISLLG